MDVRGRAQTQEAEGGDQVWEECLDDVTLPPGGEAHTIWDNHGVVPSGRWPEPGYVTGEGRDLRLDLLRGFFVMALIVDHVRGPSPLYLLTGGNRFYTSAAEGFILASGLVTGLVYQRLIQRYDLDYSLMRLLVRAVQIYLLTVGLTLIFLPVSEVLHLPWAQGLNLSRPLQLVMSIITLHRTYYLVDVLVLYTFLFALAPLAFIVLASGRAWPVLLASWALWGMWQIAPQFVNLPWPVMGNYLFNFAAWQVLFFTALVVGYRHDRIPALGRHASRLALVVAGAATMAMIVGFFILDPPTSAMPGAVAVGSPVIRETRLWLQNYVFSRADLRLGRIIVSAVSFTFLFLFVTHFWQPARRFAGWLLLPFGRHSLYAYAVNVAVVGCSSILLLRLNMPYPGPQWLNAIIQGASILLIWVIIRGQVAVPRSTGARRLWYAAPAILALVAVLVLPVVAAREVGVLNAAPVAQTTPVPGAEAPSGTPAPTPTLGATGLAPAFATPTMPPRTPKPTPRPGVRGTPVPGPESRLDRYRTYLTGQLEEDVFHSQALDRTMPYVVYLPPDYDTADRHYPVLYMLHGRGGSRDEWLAYGLMDVADELIRTGAIEPMIIIVPQGDTWYWTNNADNGPRWGDYVDYDLVGHIDATYRTLHSPQSRAIGGLSMGGWGALYHGFTHPEIFGVIGAHSPSLRLPGDPSIDFLGTAEQFTKIDPVTLAQTVPNDGRLQIWLDTAEKDPWRERTTQLHDILAGRGVAHTWQVYPGQHDYTYWHEHAVDYLKFYGHALARQ